MTELERVLRALHKEGKTPEEVAKEITDTLNALEKEDSVTKEREKYVKGLVDEFTEAWEMDFVSFDDVAKAATYAAAGAYPAWTLAQLKEFREMAEKSMKMIAKCVASKDPFGVLAEEAEKIAEEFFETRGKKKEGGGDRKRETPERVILDFLRDL